MMHPGFRLFLLLVYAGMPLFGQADFRPGYFIDLNNDTIPGEIDSRGEIRNSRFCLYRTDDQSDPEKFLPGEILAYRFLEGKYLLNTS
ncbi:MAG: hypothetical protein ABFS38_05815 [Bacteroidota bacterium]